jgi:hypothetical protein
MRHLAMIDRLHPFCKVTSGAYPSRRIGVEVAGAVPVYGRGDGLTYCETLRPKRAYDVFFPMFWPTCPRI